MLASGQLKISPEAWDASQDGEIIELVEAYLVGKLARAEPENSQDYEGKILLAVLRPGTAVIHVLAGHGHDFTEVVLAE